MDIHKIRPVRGMKDFFSEIGIIVVGVLIALGAEQTVEAVHWHHQVDLERESMRANAQQHLGIVAHRQALQSCVDRRLTELALIFERHHSKQPLKLAGPVGRPQNEYADTGSWQVALTGQAIGHMKLGERDDWAGAFANFNNLHQLEVDADRAWIALSPLDHADLLEEGDWVELRRAYANVVATEGRIRRVVPYVLRLPDDQTSANMGQIHPPSSLDKAAYDDYSKAFCGPLLADTGSSPVSAVTP